MSLVFTGTGLAAALVTAACLTPDPEGLGTHQQLGLNPCTIRVLFHIPCPTCGMTTSWAHLVRGQAFAALEANAGGAILCLLAMVIAPWSLASGLAGRWIVYEPGHRAPPLLAGVVVTISMLQWVLRM